MLPHRLRPFAFTLVELLVAMTVLALLLVILLGVFNATTNNWQRGEARTDAYREARAALALMARDLGATIPPILPTNAIPPGVAALAPSLVLDRHPDDSAVSRSDPNEQAHCLTLIANRPVRAGAVPTALCAVSYFCRWDAQRTTWTLARRLVDSDAVFTRLKTVPPGTVVPFGVLFQRDPATVSDTDDIAAYVWDLQFRVPTTLDKPVGTAQPAPASDGGFYAVQPPYPDRLPPYVEVRFKAMSSAAGARLRGGATQATWTNPDDPLYRTAIRPYVQQFVQRVPLHTAP